MTHAPNRSLSGRLFLASLFLLPLFLGGTGWYLQGSYQRSLESAVAQRLQLQVLTLMAEAEFDAELTMPEQLLEARFNQINSGLFGVVRSKGNSVLWSSPSAVATDLQSLQPADNPAAGEQGFAKDGNLYSYWFSVLWQTESGEEIPLVFTVLETTAPTAAQLASLRRSLILWLGGTTFVLLICQLLVLHWGLRPLRDLADEITQIESGEKDRLEGSYPREIQALTNNLNSLLQVEKQRSERTRNTLADLAHSLKTPLAVIRSADPKSPDFGEQVNSQTNQMEQIVSYQLQRASGGSHNLMRHIPVRETATRVQKTLAKVYADKALQISLNIPSSCQFRGDERDLMELLGNLMENACKYGRSQVKVSASGRGTTLNISVEDDGPGIPTALRERILQRGIRADSSTPGQGIGLAVAMDIASSYGGSIEVTHSAIGGACLRVHFST